MARCPRCSSRKAKRSCPALGVEICAVCCAEGRLSTIACPVDCHYLQSEHYQQSRRMERAYSQGRGFVRSIEKSFSSEAEREIAMKICADIHYFAEHEGPVEDHAIIETADALGKIASGAVSTAGPLSPLTLYLRERLADAKRYPATSVAGTRVLATIAGRARTVTAEGSRRLVEEIASFFRPLDFEADLDYSPRDGKDPSAPLYDPGGEARATPPA